MPARRRFPFPLTPDPMRFLLALLLAAPVMAQSSTETPAPPVEAVEPETEAVTIDPALVGAWTLDQVTAPGVLASFGVDVQSMTATFSADGQAKIAMTAVQDGETLFRDRTFAFSTDDGKILEDGDDPVVYMILEDGALELIDNEMVIRFVRATS